MNLKIALLQLLPGKDLDEQLKIGVQACRKAKEIGADIALFLEMWNTGYVIPQDEEEGIYLAEIDMNLLRDYRENEVMGDKYRHPEKYGILCERD